MRGTKISIKSFLNFSKKELNGILILNVLIFIVLASPFAYKLFSNSPKYNFKPFKIDAQNLKKSLPVLTENMEKLSLKKDNLFYFDPNLISDQDWEKLGLSSKQIKVIRNYVKNGGKFYQKDDLKRIYSISESHYLMLEPFIQIAHSKSADPNNKFIKSNRPVSSIQIPVIELNTADSITLLKVRGIGPAFASRIIRFRNRIGGFYQVDQLREVYGIDSIKFSQIQDQLKVNSALIQKINVNKVTFEQLKSQPYLTYKQINAIIQYRHQHGNFNEINDLKKIVVLNEEIIRKIEPYIEF
jgi:DNA uptake protein ComE-like DNA-binding protein